MVKKKGNDRLTNEQVLANNLIPIEVDIGLQEFNGEKELKSLKVIYKDPMSDNFKEYWKAQHYSTGDYWTPNPRDPKILNVHDFGDGKPPKIRGNVKWKDGGGNPAGKPKGTLNKVSVKEALAKQQADPAEFLTAVMTGNHEMLRRYKVKDTKDVTLAQKIKVAQVLLDKTTPNLKPVDLDKDGNPVIAQNIQDFDNRNQIQVYLPGTQKSTAIDVTEGDLRDLEKTTPADMINSVDTDTSLEWEVVS